MNRLPRRRRQAARLHRHRSRASRRSRRSATPGCAQLLDEYDAHFTIGENIGRAGLRDSHRRVDVACRRGSRSRSTCGSRCRAVPRRAADDHRPLGRARVACRSSAGARYSWSKRDEWMRFLDLPRAHRRRVRAGHGRRQDARRRARCWRQHGWAVADPLAVSTDAERYRDYIRSSRGEFSVAKELNVAPGDRLVLRPQRLLPRRRPSGGRAGHRAFAPRCRPGRAC